MNSHQKLADTPYTHVAFSDEKGYNAERFAGIGLVSLKRTDHAAIFAGLQTLLVESDIKEFGWKKLQSAKYRFAAEKMVDFVVNQARRGALRIDVVTWDSQDDRHSVLLPDHVANLQGMYFQLFRNVLRSRWPDTAVWALFPDQHSALDWNTVESRLGRVSESIQRQPDLTHTGGFATLLRSEFYVQSVEEKESQAEPLIQLADLFVGLGCYSRDKYSVYKHWVETETGTMRLFADDQAPTISKVDRERCLVLKRLVDSCKRNSLGVSINSQAGLKTPNPRNPVNFWWYTSQHAADKAPSRK